MKIVKFSNGKYGIRRPSWNPALLLFELCPFEFLAWFGTQAKFRREDAQNLVNGHGWYPKSCVDGNDVFDTLEEAQKGYDNYLAKLEKAKAIVAESTFNCGTPV